MYDIILLCVWSQAQCQEVRKRKELELQILTEPVRGWEGEGIKTLGTVIYMSQVLMQYHGSEVSLHTHATVLRHVLICLCINKTRTSIKFGQPNMNLIM